MFAGGAGAGKVLGTACDTVGDGGVVEDGTGWLLVDNAEAFAWHLLAVAKSPAISRALARPVQSDASFWSC